MERKTQKRIIYGMVAGTAVIVLIVALGMWIALNMTFTDCSDTITETVVSPDQQYSVTVFQRDCGATAPIATQVNIQPRYRGKFDSEKGKIVMVMEGVSPVKVEWTGPKELKLTYPFIDVFRKEESWNGISIKHEQTNPA